MNPRTTGILFVLAAALGAFVWFYEIRGEAGRKDAEAAAKRLFPGIEPSAVEQIELTTSDGQRARLERRETDWALSRTDPALSGRSPRRRTGSSPTRSPRRWPSSGASRSTRRRSRSRSMAWRTSGTTCASGRATSITCFASAGRPPSAAINTPSSGASLASTSCRASRVNALVKSLDELREKRVLRFDAGSVERATLRWPDAHVALSRGEAGWRLEEPLVGPADATTVEALLNDLSFLRASGFVDAPTPEQLRALEHPELEVELTTKAEAEAKPAARILLTIGAREGGQGDRLVRTAGAAGLFRIPSERLQDFPRDVASYRFRDVARFDLDLAERLEIVFQPAGEAALTLSATRDDEGWSSSPEAIAPVKLATMIDELSRLRANRILADAMGEAELRQLGLAPPNARFTVSSKSGQLAQVDIGVVRGSDGVVARAPAGPTVYLLAPTLADYLPVNLEALRSRFLAKSGAAEAPAASDEAAESASDAASSGAGPEEGAP